MLVKQANVHQYLSQTENSPLARYSAIASFVTKEQQQKKKEKRT
jgi:hypothetical protein